MIKEVIINLINNKKFFIKISTLFAVFLSLISIFLSCAVSYFQSIKHQAERFGASNYYNISEEVMDEDIRTVFKDINYESLTLKVNRNLFKLSVQDTNYISRYTSLKLIDISQNDLLLPQNVKNTFNSYGKEYCSIGRLPENYKEICITFNLSVNIYNDSDSRLIKQEDLLNKRITFTDYDGTVLLENYIVVGILEYGLYDIFDDCLIFYGKNGQSVVGEIENINRIYISNFSYVDSINARIKEKGINDKIVYGGTQYGLYVELRDFSDFAFTIFLLISISLFLTLIISFIISINQYYSRQKLFFYQLLVLGYRKKDVYSFVFMELLFCGIFALLISTVVGLLSVYLLKYIYQLFYIEMILNVNIVLITFAALSAVLLIFLACVVLCVNKIIIKQNIYSVTKVS